MKRDIFQALADPTRRAILLLLATKSMTPNAMAEHFDSSRQAVSKHLQVLSEAELVKQVREGREVHYHVIPSRLDDLDKYLNKFRELLDKRFSQLDELLTKLKNNSHE